MEKRHWAPRDAFWSPANSDNASSDMITSIFLVLICSAIAHREQAKPQPITRGQNTTVIKVYPARGKRIRVVAGAERTLIDLKGEISGCLQVYDPHATKPMAEQPLRMKV